MGQSKTDGMHVAKQSNFAKIRHNVTDYIVMMIGIMLYTFGWTGFILSQNITTGGLAGISTIIKIATGMPAAIPYNIINIGLAVVGLIFLGWRFMVKTTFGVLLLAVVIPIAESFFKNPLLANEPFMAVAVGSIICGLGMGMVFGVNGSTGGTDIIMAIINKYKNMSLGRAMMMIDFIIISCSYFVNVYIAGVESSHAINLLIFSAVEVLIVSLTLDWYLNSNRQSIQYMIFSNKFEEINEAIKSRLDRGTTLLNATGGYSAQPVKVLMVVTRKSQSVAIYRIIHEIDPNAFVSEAVVRGVYGRGFQQIKG